MNTPNDNAFALRLNAWLDQELPAGEAAEIGTQVDANPALTAEVANFRQMDALLKNWYAGLPLETKVAKPAARKVNRRWALLTIAALAALLVLAVIPALRNNSRTLAEEALDRTAEALKLANGILATYSVETMRVLEQPNERGEKEDRRKATGEIKYGRLDAPVLNFRCDEQWEAPRGEDPLERSWGQAAGMQWVTEKVGMSTTSTASHYSYDPAAHTGMDTLGGDRSDGSPVDVRTRRAVEGLALLIRSFGKDAYLQWMGLEWKFQGGKGTLKDQWVYAVDVDSRLTETEPKMQREKIVWTVKIAAEGPSGTVSHVTVEEDIKKPDGTPHSSFKTNYKLTLKNDAWPKELFRGSVLDDRFEKDDQ